MTIFYALVARQKTVLAEYIATSGNFPTITRLLLGKITPEDQKMSYVCDQHVFHYIVEDGLTYLCMAEESAKRRIPFQFLEDIKGRFQSTYGERAKQAIAFAMNDEFSRVLKTQIVRRAASFRRSLGGLWLEVARALLPCRRATHKETHRADTTARCSNRGAPPC